jgi:hypothetical protein
MAGWLGMSVSSGARKLVGIAGEVMLARIGERLFGI